MATTVKAKQRYKLDSTPLEIPPSRADLSLGTRNIGKPHVDCAFLHKKTRWGKLQEARGGIIHIELTFDQPTAYKLRNTSVTLTFEQNSTTASCDHPHILKNAPKMLCGLPTSVDRSNQTAIMPEVEGGAFGKVSGLGWSQMKGYKQHFRWQFKLSRLSKGKAGSLYNELVCRWTANPKNEQDELVVPLRLAIAIEHHNNPFVVNLDITGSLASGMRRFRYLLQSRKGSSNRVIISPELGDDDIEDDVATLQDQMSKANGVHIPVIGPQDPASC